MSENIPGYEQCDSRKEQGDRFRQQGDIQIIVIFGYGIDEEEERNCGLSFITVLKTYQYQQDTAPIDKGHADWESRSGYKEDRCTPDVPDS